MAKNKEVTGYGALRLVGAGLIIELLAAAAAAAIGVITTLNNTWITRISDSWMIFMGTAFGCFALSLILLLVGLGKSKRYSKRFGRAKVFYVMNIVFGVVAAAITVVLIRFTDTFGANVKMVLYGACGVIGFLMLIFGIIAVFSMISGCADAASKAAHREYVKKCRKTWAFYLLTALLVFAAALFLAFMIYQSMNTIQSHIAKADSPLEIIGYVDNGVMAAILLCVCCILNLIARFGVIGRLFSVGGLKIEPQQGAQAPSGAQNAEAPAGMNANAAGPAGAQDPFAPEMSSSARNTASQAAASQSAGAQTVVPGGTSASGQTAVPNEAPDRGTSPEISGRRTAPIPDADPEDLPWKEDAPGAEADQK